MKSWFQRSREERVLLNPAFCANLLWHAARGYSNNGNGALSFEEAFLVLPFVLHRETREALPRSMSTSLAVWLDNNPLVRGRIASRAQLLVTITKEGLVFGGVHRFILVENGGIYANELWRKNVNKSLKESSDEVRGCAKKAEFLGKWFALNGSSLTILALIGVRP
ncbi:MAG: three component ABC system middle component [Deltaproteobacteria bacterium]